MQVNARRRLLMCATAGCVAGVGGLGSAGCLSPDRAARAADDAAYGIIAGKQVDALGYNEEFTVGGAEQELRRRLLLEQELPAAGGASYGRAFIPPVRREADAVGTGGSLPDGAAVEPHVPLVLGGVGRPVFSTNVALVQVGTYPSTRNLGALPGDASGERLGVADTAEPEPLTLALVDALQVAAANSREYQTRKENVFVAALNLDLQRDRFQVGFGLGVDVNGAADFRDGQDVAGVSLSPQFRADKLFKNGIGLTTRIGVDLARLLTGDRGSSLGTFADASVTVPLLAGAGVEVVTEPLHQAEREAVYAIWGFERFKHEFAVSVVTSYYNVLVARDQIANAAATLRRLTLNVERARALYDVGRLPSIELDRVRSTQLRAEVRLIQAEQRFESQLDRFKTQLGLPADARVELDNDDLDALTAQADRVLGRLADTPEVDLAGEIAPEVSPEPDTSPDAAGETLEAATQDPAPVAADPGADRDDVSPRVDRGLAEAAIRVALGRRLDLATSYGRVVDAQRQTVVAADGLRGVLDVTGSAAYGGRRGALSGGQEDATLDFSQGVYGLGLRLDLPIDRLPERNEFRRSVIDLDRAVRDAQAAEDGVKLDIADALRRLRTAGETVQIQFEAIRVARRRVEAANLLVAEGRGNTRDITEAETDFTDAQDNFTRALVDYRLAELELQRDTGVLRVTPRGLLEEVDLFAAASP